MKELTRCNVNSGDFCNIMEKMFHGKLYLPPLVYYNEKDPEFNYARYTRMPILALNKRKSAHIIFCPFCGVDLRRRFVPLDKKGAALKLKWQMR